MAGKVRLTAGKVRGLQQIATEGGIFVICAMDHRGSLEGVLNKVRPGLATYETMVERKLELCAALGPYSTGVLLDPLYGAAQCIAGGALRGDRGLLVSIETSGYEGASDARITTLLEGWGVEKIKRMGASAVKILVYYRPDLADVAKKQGETVRRVGEEAARHDIPLLVEAVSYRLRSETAEQCDRRRPEIVVETARQLTSLPVDVLKAEFPADMRYVTGESGLIAACRRLDEASQLPWVLLSGGVSYDVFLRQVEIACRGGASGFLGGRAIWQEAMVIEDRKERVKFLSTVAADRLKRLVDAATKYGVPWHRKLGLKTTALAPVEEGWYRSY